MDVRKIEQSEYSDDQGDPLGGISLWVEDIEAIVEIPHLLDAPEIREVALAHLTITDSTDLSPLAQLQNIESIRFFRCALPCNHAVRQLPPIRNLSFEYCTGEVSMDCLLAQAATLESLILYESSDILISGIGQLRNLQHLLVFTDESSDLAHIRELRSLNELELHFKSGICDVSWLSELRTLCKLFIEGQAKGSWRIVFLRELKSASLYCPNLSIVQRLFLELALPKCSFSFPGSKWDELREGMMFPIYIAVMLGQNLVRLTELVLGLAARLRNRRNLR